MTDELTHFKIGTNSRQSWETFMRQLNSVVDAVNEHTEIFEAIEEESQRMRRVKKPEAKLQRASGGETVFAANLTGKFLGIYNAVKIESPPVGDRESIDLLNEFHNNESIMLAKVPGDDDYIFAVTLSPVDKKGVVTAKLTGVTGMMVDIEDTAHEYATVKSGQTDTLVSTEAGYARLMFPATKTGKQFCYILLGVSAAVEADEETAIVMRAIEYSDPTAPPEDRQYGKIMLPGVDPPRTEGGEIDIDKLPDCCCLFLGKDPEEPEEDEKARHQQLIKGDEIKRTGPHKRKNPNYDPDDDESEEPEYIDYYIADPIMEYTLPIDADVQWDMEADPPTFGHATITRKDSDGTEAVMYVSGERITQGFKVTGNAESYIVRNKDTAEGRKLLIVGGRCQQRVE